MAKVGVYNEDGEPIGFDYVYDDEYDDGDPYDEYDLPYRPSIDDDETNEDDR